MFSAPHAWNKSHSELQLQALVTLMEFKAPVLVPYLSFVSDTSCILDTLTLTAPCTFIFYAERYVFSLIWINI